MDKSIDDEEAKKRAEHERVQEEIRKKRAKEPLDAFLNLMKVGDKVKFCSDCYKLHDIENNSKFHGEVLEIDKSIFVPEKEVSDSYSGKGGTFWFLKVKDVIGKETFWSLAELVMKV